MTDSCRLMILIGLPGSGKSTLAYQLMAAWPTYRLVSTDAIRGQLFGDPAVQGDWRLVWHQVRLQFQSALLEGASTIYDATNVKRANRQDVIKLGRELGFSTITGIWIRTRLQECLARNRSRDRQVPEEIILSMYRQLWGAPPSLSEGMDHLIFYQPTRKP
ncbi:AAA family ATPase [Roseofilum capinflatum]|uniref:AAA family ATPase n=1 Tax=Roseofilum capinflatum BLCC-M114 TaxID=3022440 RepID=A0ABT7BC97_9CYAN|nr:AAA family ATPase [Roseofilum capinflatum]MDJ1176690.1 AAA family ATPase [Roseofilum capinflatum BLCC-M114]